MGREDPPEMMRFGGTEGSDASPGQSGGPDPQRRMLLTGIAAACLSSLAPPAAGAQPVENAADDAFLALSQYLTGRSSPDAEQAARLQEALAAETPGFGADIRSLLALIDGRKIDPAELQRVLDAEDSPLAALPRKVIRAWYTGIVGEGDGAHCITFETSLMYVAVADHLNPPSYCAGPYGSWKQKPG